MAPRPEEELPIMREVPELKDVAGPSALGGSAKRFFDLLYLISVNDFKRTYFGTVLGYFWSLLRPLALFAVLLFVFTKIFRIGDCLLYTSPSPRDGLLSRMPSSA